MIRFDRVRASRLASICTGKQPVRRLLRYRRRLEDKAVNDRAVRGSLGCSGRCRYGLRPLLGRCWAVAGGAPPVIQP